MFFRLRLGGPLGSLGGPWGVLGGSLGDISETIIIIFSDGRAAQGRRAPRATEGRRPRVTPGYPRGNPGVTLVALLINRGEPLNRFLVILGNPGVTVESI